MWMGHGCKGCKSQYFCMHQLEFSMAADAERLKSSFVKQIVLQSLLNDLTQDLKSQIRFNKLITMGGNTDGLTPVDQSKLKLSV